MSINKWICSVALAGVIGMGWAACAWSQTASAPAKEYAIKLSRPVKVGQTFQFAASGSEKNEQITTAGGKTQTKKDELVFEVKGVSQILKTDDKGQALEVAFTVDTCVKIDGDTRSEAAPKGTVAIVSAINGKKDVRAKDSKVTLSPDATRILDSAIDVHTSPGNDDDAFGTDKPQRIGDSWPINSEFMAKSFSKMLGKEGALKNEDVTGRTKLVGLTKANDVDCLELRMQIKIRNFAPPMPPGATVVKGELTGSEKGYLPLDQTFPMQGGQHAMASMTVVKIKAEDGSEVTLEMKTQRVLTGTDKLISK